VRLNRNNSLAASVQANPAIMLTPNLYVYAGELYDGSVETKSVAA
jgi:hypothetical protein